MDGRTSHEVLLLKQSGVVPPEILEDLEHILETAGVEAADCLVCQVVALCVSLLGVHSLLLYKHFGHLLVAVV